MSRHWGALLGLLWVHVCWVRGLEVEQRPSALSLQEGAGAALKCNFSSSVQSVQWFRQNPGGGGLTSLFFIASGMKQSGRLNCTLNTRERSSALHIAASQLEDAASYLCAAETQCCLLIWGLHANCSCACALAPLWDICTHSSLGSFSDFQTYVTAPFPSKMRPIRILISLAFLALFLPSKTFGSKNSTMEPLEQVMEMPISHALGKQISRQVA
uniref:Uncharacterized LOC103682249 n=1 Tax=Ursus maritimus TaxID=29073 RepID=A0A384DSM9_URSMA